jgi:hypothetical protein
MKKSFLIGMLVLGLAFTAVLAGCTTMTIRHCPLDGTSFCVANSGGDGSGGNITSCHASYCSVQNIPMTPWASVYCDCFAIFD